MTMTTTRFLQRTAAGFGALALAAAGALALAAPAAAQSQPGPGQPGAPDSGSLTINKYKGAPRENPAPADLLNGVEFTVTQVGTTVGTDCVPLNLAQASAWDGLPALFATTPASLTGDFCYVPGAQSATTVSGQAQFSNLDLGVYFVSETDPGPNNIVSKVPDFFVSVPMPQGASGWLYDVVANPKNQLMDAPTKTVADPETFVTGAIVPWTISARIPTLNDEKFTVASVNDVLDSRLSYVSSIVSIGSTVLEEDTHYTVNPAGVTWTFTEAGRLLLDGQMGQTLTIVMKTRVGDVGDGAIPNMTYSATFNGATVPGGTVPYTYWGKLTITKNDNSQPARPLAGAQFQVFSTAADGTCPATAPSSGALATGTSNNAGLVEWAGLTPNNPLTLWIANSPDNPITPSPTKGYCVFETVIPAGHLATPIANPVMIGASPTPLELNVVNPRREGPRLPMTGAQGTLVLTAGGLALIGLGAGGVAVARRRNDVA
ncbi:MAG: SpaH/EbpB family LPXTG-anchored major pilin [bacterium]|nr:SpaH/EbpB family LPXTG-anchored major pilin [bacterium]